jgi:tetratricopeptide (TPR) repeat protein
MQLATIALLALTSPANDIKAPTVADCENAYSDVIAQNYEPPLQTLKLCAANQKSDAVSRSRYHLGRAWALQSLGRLNEAIAEMEMSFALPNPPYRLQIVNYATMLRSAGRLEDSLKAIVERGEKIDKAEGEGPSMMIHYHKGWTLQEMGRHPEAIKAFTAGIPQQKDYPFVYLRRAASYAAINNREWAKADMRKFSEYFTIDWRKYVSAQELSEYRKQLIDYGLTPSW